MDSRREEKVKIGQRWGWTEDFIHEWERAETAAMAGSFE
jgi:hypothetical protein